MYAPTLQRVRLQSRFSFCHDEILFSAFSILSNPSVVLSRERPYWLNLFQIFVFSTSFRSELVPSFPPLLPFVPDRQAMPLTSPRLPRSWINSRLLSVLHSSFHIFSFLFFSLSTTSQEGRHTRFSAKELTALKEFRAAQTRIASKVPVRHLSRSHQKYSALIPHRDFPSLP